MFSALFSFLGGSVFRMIWGEVSEWANKRQDHQHEMEAMKLQSELEAQKHAQEMERMQVMNSLQIKTIEVQSEADLAEKDAQAFNEAMKTVMTPTGVKWVDAWNGSIRPAAATTCLLLWWFCLYNQDFNLSDWDKELVGVILGFYFAHRVFANKK
jgi:hypothetical protein